MTEALVKWFVIVTMAFFAVSLIGEGAVESLSETVSRVKFEAPGTLSNKCYFVPMYSALICKVHKIPEYH